MLDSNANYLSFAPQVAENDISNFINASSRSKKHVAATKNKHRPMLVPASSTKRNKESMNRTYRH